MNRETSSTVQAVVSPEPLPGEPARDVEDLAARVELSGRRGEVQSAAQRPMAFWWVVLFVLVLHTESVAFSFNLVSPTLVPVATEFHTTQLGWLFTAMTLVGAVTTPLLTRLGDIAGKKLMILVVTAIATAGALLVAIANSFALVLVGRAMEGVLLALIPLVYSLMRDTFPSRILAFAVTIAASGVGIVTIAGPFLAGYLVDNHGWRSVFWFLAAEQAIGFIAILAIVPASKFRTPARLDVGGGLLIGASIALALLAVSEGNAWGWTSTRTVACFGASALILATWIYVEKRVAEPLISLGVLRQRAVSTVLGVGFLAQATLGLAATMLPILVMTPRALGKSYGFGVDATGLAVFTATAGVATVVVGFLLGAIIKRTGPKLPVLVGLILSVIGALFLAYLHEQRWQVMLGFALLGITQALVISAIPSMVIAAVPRDVQGISAGMSGTTQSLGGAVGPTVGFAILAAHVGSVEAGQPIYANSGFVYAYLLAGLLAVAAIVVALAVPKLDLSHLDR
jgi:MFS family permease